MILFKIIGAFSWQCVNSAEVPLFKLKEKKVSTLSSCFIVNWWCLQWNPHRIVLLFMSAQRILGLVVNSPLSPCGFLERGKWILH